VDQPFGTEQILTASQEETASWLEKAGLTIRHNQMSKGPYAAKFERVSLSSELRFSLSSYSVATTARGAPPPDAYTFTVPVSSPAGVYFNAQPLGPDHIAVVLPGGEFHVSRPARFRALVLYANERIVDRRCLALRGVPARTVFNGSAHVRAEPAALAAFCRQVAQVADRAFTGSLAASGASPTSLSERLTDSIIGALEPEPLHGWSDRKRLIDRAWQVVEDDTANVVGVGELCTLLEVPLRTLDTAFRIGVGIAPKRFILGMRLNKARRLLSAPGRDTCVTQVATSLNFFHFGHFSHHYARLFGETPLQTLRRGREKFC
jgi:AraC family ethanolamine operon transcriptional activator